MLKLSLTAASIAFLFAIAPTQAQTKAKMVCNEAEITKLEIRIAAMPDATKKEVAMKKAAKAREMMAKKDETGCTAAMEDTFAD